MPNWFLYNFGFDAPTVIESEEISEQTAAYTEAVSGNDGVAEVINAHRNGGLCDDGSIEWIFFSKRATPVPCRAYVKKTYQL